MSNTIMTKPTHQIIAIQAVLSAAERYRAAMKVETPTELQAAAQITHGEKLDEALDELETYRRQGPKSAQEHAHRWER